mgnify:CR=1 FL=1
MIKVVEIFGFIKELTLSQDKMTKFKEITQDIKELINDIKDVIKLIKG